MTSGTAPLGAYIPGHGPGPIAPGETTIGGIFFDESTVIAPTMTFTHTNTSVFNERWTFDYTAWSHLVYSWAVSIPGNDAYLSHGTLQEVSVNAGPFGLVTTMEQSRWVDWNDVPGGPQFAPPQWFDLFSTNGEPITGVVAPGGTITIVLRSSGYVVRTANMSYGDVTGEFMGRLSWVPES